MFDWQSIAVVVIICGAVFYVARRGLARLRSFNASRASCATGCGKCGDGATPTPQTAPRLVQIKAVNRKP